MGEQGLQCMVCHNNKEPMKCVSIRHKRGPFSDGNSKILLWFKHIFYPINVSESLSLY